MTRLESLRALYDAVGAGTPLIDLPRPIELHTDLVWKASQGSVDAALALIEATLPGWDWLVNSGRHYAMIWDADRDSQDSAEAIHPNPATALLLACLAALIAEVKP